MEEGRCGFLFLLHAVNGFDHQEHDKCHQDEINDGGKGSRRISGLPPPGSPFPGVPRRPLSTYIHIFDRSAPPIMPDQRSNQSFCKEVTTLPKRLHDKGDSDIDKVAFRLAKNRPNSLMKTHRLMVY